MAGVSLSFVASPRVAERIREIAGSDGITASQAVARSLALGVGLPSSARRTLRFVLSEGGEEARSQLISEVTKAIARVGNSVVEARLRTHAKAHGSGVLGETEEELAAQAVQAVADYRREQTTAAPIRKAGVREPSAGFG